MSEIEKIPLNKLYYIDECGCDTFLYREYARAPRGETVVGKISGKKFKRINIVAAKCIERIIAPMIYDGTTDGELFEFWFEHEFLKCVPENSVAIMDNATFHRKAKLKELADNACCKLLFLPPYSPDLNPIEKHWAWLKRKLRDILKSYEVFMDALQDCF